MLLPRTSELNADQQEHLAEQQRQAGQSGLLSMAGFLLAMTAGPIAMRAGAGRMIGRLGGKTADDAFAAVKSRITASTAAARDTALSATIRRKPIVERARLAAARQRANGSISTSGFLSDLGFTGPKRWANEGTLWRDFKSTDDVRKKGVMRAMFNEKLVGQFGGQRKLMRSFVSEYKREQMLAIPAVYAADSHLGVMGPPEEQPAAWNIYGQATQFIKWLPKYFAYDIGGRSILAAPGAAKSVMYGARNMLHDKQGIARAVSSGMTGMLSMQRAVQDISGPLRNAYRQTIAMSQRKVGNAVSPSTRKLYARLYKKAYNKVSKAFKQHNVHELESIIGAQHLFGRDSSEFFTRVQTDSNGAFQRLYKNMFVDDQREVAPDLMARLFNGKEVSIAEVQASHKLSKEATEQLEHLKGKLERFKTNIAASTAAPEIKARAAKMEFENLRASGFMSVKGEIMRTPTSGEMRHLFGKVATRATTIYNPLSGRDKQGVSLFRLFNLQSFTEARSPMQVVKGGMDIDGQLHYFHAPGRSSRNIPAELKLQVGNEHVGGVMVGAAPGSMKAQVFGLSKSGDLVDLTGGGMTSYSGFGSSKMQRIRMRAHLRHTSSDSGPVTVRAGRAHGKFMSTLLSAAREKMEKLQIGGTGEGAYRLKSLFGRTRSQQLFRQDSGIWDTNTENYRELAEHTVRTLRTALTNAGDVFTHRTVFKSVMTEDTLKQMKLSASDIDALLSDDRVARTAARNLMDHFSSTRDASLRAPSWAAARKILNNSLDHPDHIFNTTGRSQGQTLRQFIAEQSIIGISKNGGGRLNQTHNLIENLSKKGFIRKDLAAEAHAGLAYIRLQSKLGPHASGMAFLRNPYGAQMPEARERYMMELVNESLTTDKKHLQAFAASRPRFDWSYSTAGPQTGDVLSDMEMAQSFVIKPTVGKMLGVMAESGFDTTRQALSSIGLGWDARYAVSTEKGRNALMKLWGKRALAFGAGTLAYRTLDTGTDLAIPDGWPLSEGITAAGANIAANARIASASVYDALGISDAASYLEGLMPKSVSTLPGAALGFYAAGWKGAIVGSVLNRMTVETLKDTPFEALSLLPPLAPFVSDLSESSESVKAKYAGDQLVPIRKGRFFLLSATDYSGGRVEQWRPNWFASLKGNPRATPALYGSELEQFFFEPLPLIDFAIGDVFDPQYVQKKNYYDRPYVDPRVPFSGMPVIGPSVGRWLGRTYNLLHPLGSNSPMHVEAVAQQLQQGTVNLLGPNTSNLYGSAMVGSPIMGTQEISGAPRIYSDSGIGTGYYQSGTIMGAQTARVSYDEQLYRLSEAMGFTGFFMQQAMGGEGIFRDPVFASASDMTDFGRKYHDMSLGDMMGFGEAARRLYPFQRDAERFGPKNTQANWMPAKFQTGDPYCLLPDTRIEVDQTYMRAEDAHELLNTSTDTHYARTRRSKVSPYKETAVRDVDEEIMIIEFEGIPYPLEVTKGHPVLIHDPERDSARKTTWVLAGEVQQGTYAINLPIPVTEEGIEIGSKIFPHSGVLTKGLIALTKTQPLKIEKCPLIGVTDEDIFDIENAFQLSGSKYIYRKTTGLSALRREMADWGLPRSLVGASDAALKPLVLEWGEVVDVGARRCLRITLNKARLGLLDRPEWTSERQAYVPAVSADVALERAVWTLYRALAFVTTPAHVSYDPEKEEFHLDLYGPHAARYLYTAHQRSQHAGDTYFGVAENSVQMVYDRNEKYVGHQIKSIKTKHYKGPVYAFEVQGKSFVSAGVLTHNSKIKNGEMLLPGEGYEAMGFPVGERELTVSDIGPTVYDTTLNMLGLTPVQEPDEMSWAKDQATKMLLSAGLAQKREALYVDGSATLVGIASAATRGNNPIHIEALNDAEFRATYRPRELDTERLNALVGMARRTRGSLVYVNSETGETQTFVTKFDSGLYNQSLQKLRQAREQAYELAEMGAGARGAMYSTVDRLQVLLNAAPFSSEWRTEMRKAKALEAAGSLSLPERKRLKELEAMHYKTGLPFEIYNERFSYGQLLNPDDSYFNHTYNDNIQAAANYSLPERLAGSVWENWSNLRTPLHTKFFGSYNLEEEYERRVLLSRDFQSWASPVDDFVKPYMRGLISADDPLQGGLSAGIGGLVFGGPAYGFMGATLGTVYGAVHGGYRKLTGTAYVPEEINELRQVEQTFDRLQYYRAKRLYDATRDPSFLQEMQRTSYGWRQDGLSRSGWAKERRTSFSPARRLESGLYNTDSGFSSPWQGLRAIKSFGDALRKHNGTVLTIGEGIKAQPLTRLMRQPTPVAKSLNHGMVKARPITEGFHPRGLSKTNRQANTSIAGNLGFGSPWQGQVAAADILYDPSRPQDNMPPEMYMALAAAPGAEKDFMRAALMLNDPKRQERFARLISPDMRAMLDVGYNYLYGQPLQGAHMPELQGLNAGLSDHPIMGPGAFFEGYQIRTMQDMGLDAHDLGIGWQSSMLRLNRAVAQPESLAPLMGSKDKKLYKEGELTAIIQTALQQMGVFAQVNITSTNAPTEIHLSQKI